MKMSVIIVFAFLSAFVICILVGKRLIPWLKKKDVLQPLKDEVATIYDDQNDDSAEEH